MKDATVITQKYSHLRCPLGTLQGPKLAYFVQSGLGAEFSSDIYVDQRYEKKLFIAWQNVSISLCTWKEYFPWYFLSFCIELTYLISNVDIWLYETVDSQHVLKVVFSSLLSEALPRFVADSTKPASLLRSSSLQNTYIINTAGALRIVPSYPSVPLFAFKKLLLENSLYKEGGGYLTRCAQDGKIIFKIENDYMARFFQMGK